MKELYEAPEVQVIELEVQGMIAASSNTDGLTIPGYGAGTFPGNP